MENRFKLTRELDYHILNNNLVELHTHLMGMGDADFWVNRVIETFLPDYLVVKPKEEDVFYPLKDILVASGYHINYENRYQRDLAQAKLEAKMMDGFTLSQYQQLNSNSLFSDCKDDKIGIYNRRLAILLEESDQNSSLRSVVRNWFEFLNSNGSPPSHNDILDTYRGNFFPKFYPQRFRMREVIVNGRPDVISLLIYHVMHQYGKSGVGYVEFSLSSSYFLDDKFLPKLSYAWNLSHLYEEKKEKRKAKSAENKNKRVKFESKNDEINPEYEQSKNGGEVEGDEEEKYEEEVEYYNQMQFYQFLGNFRIVAQPLISAMGFDQLTKTSTPAETKDDENPISVRQMINFQPNALNQTYSFLIAFNRRDPILKCIEPKPKDNDLKPKVNGKELYPPSQSSSDANEKLYCLAYKYLQSKEFDGTRDDMLLDLKTYSKLLCKNENLENMFPDLFQKFKEFSPDIIQKVSNCVVGFDIVGDEFGCPFSPFSHPDFIKLVLMLMEKSNNTKVGVRFHAGEGLIRPPLNSTSDSPVFIAFSLHQYVLMSSIYQYFENYISEKSHHRVNVNDVFSHEIDPALVPNIRIGHGVAFLYECNTPESDRTQLGKDLQIFRNFLNKYQYPCELNPTSNHLLLSDSFVNNTYLNNSRTLSAYLENDLPVVLCTDDDGIWAIKQCDNHKYHVSVAHEYCSSITHGDFTNEDQICDMVELARNKSFFSLPELK